MMIRNLKHSILTLYIIIFVLSAPSYACSKFYSLFSPDTFLLVYIITGLMFLLCCNSIVFFSIYAVFGFLLIAPVYCVQYAAANMFSIGLFSLLAIPYIWLMWKKAKKDASYKPLLFIGLIPIILQIFPLNDCAIINCPTYCHSKLKNLGVALDMYKEDNGTFPEELDRISPGYITEEGLNCRALSEFKLFTYGRIKELLSPKPYVYKVNTARDEYTIYCDGYPNHELSGIGPGYPMYTSRAGLIQK